MHGAAVPGLVAGLGGDPLAPGPADAGRDVGLRHPGASPVVRMREVRHIRALSVSGEEGVPVKDAGCVLSMQIE